MQFAEVIGQRVVKEKLLSSYRDARVAHAMMFLGPEGSGTLPVALCFAQYLMCANKGEQDSCGVCPQCRKVKQLQHPDLTFTFPFYNTAKEKTDTTADQWILKWRQEVLANPYLTLEDWLTSAGGENKQLHVSVAEAGNIMHKLNLKSFEGGYKIHVIWLAEFLKNETANKLLKILEEPPNKTIFILVANSAENMLPTIMSRVQVLHIPKVQDGDIAQSLERFGIPHKEEVVHYADGNWSLALKLIHNENPNESLMNAFQMWMRLCYQKKIKEIAQWADKMHATSRDEQKLFLRYALDQIRQNLISNYTGNDIIRMNRSEKDFAIKFSPFINDRNAIDLMQQLESAHRDIGQNAYSKLVFVDLSVKVYYLLTRQ
jgi:DNA polymerase-3 subunit delta'